ncbi:hypothetical protein O181_082505 [Austropuccinia psidii MF-1]|uniref:Uncharacterized protein n=1 Tax=Austropuccinia psidii MF-1 TaxID=1389203 RepID=A0A9Q3FL92_9BASI|nr:hypothetical protein [Austropuccinia psidii MF-1]
MEVDLEVEMSPQKGKIASGIESTQGTSILQRQVSEMPIISEPELELSISSSNGDNSNSEGTNRHIHEPFQAVLHGLQGQRLGNVSTNTPRSDELLAHSENVPQRGEIVKDSNGWNQLSSRHEIKTITNFHKKKGEESKEEAQLAFTSKPQASQSPQKVKKKGRKPYSPSYRVSRIQKDAMDNVFNMARALMEFKDKETKKKSTILNLWFKIISQKFKLKIFRN